MDAAKAYADMIAKCLTPDTSRLEKLNVPVRAKVDTENWTWEIPVHDEAACKAAIEFEQWARVQDRLGRTKSIFKKDLIPFAMKHRTTPEAMEEHWRCVDSVLGKEPKQPV